MSLRITITDDLDSCMALRHEVFVHEQGVPIEEERDKYDETATHLIAHQGDVPVATARIVFLNDTAKIGRVCVVKSSRGTGLGAKLIEAAVQHAQAKPGITQAKLGAQIHAIGFYEKLGFTAFGPIYDDAGIDHRNMLSRFETQV